MWSRLAPAAETWSRTSATTVEVTDVISNATTATVSVGTEGLVFADSFARANSLVVGNGWTEDEVDAEELQISADCLYAGTVAEVAELLRETPSSVSDFIVQMNTRTPGTGASGFIVNRESDTTQYAAVWDSNDSTFKLWRRGSNVTETSSTSIDGIWLNHRVVGAWDSKGSLVVTSYYSDSPTTTDRTRGLVQGYTYTDAAALSYISYGITVGHFTSWNAMYQLSGRHIVVDGVPTIYSYGLGSRATVAGAGSADSYSVDTWALPQVNFYLYDQSGTTLASLETDFYGGTYIDVSVTSGTTTLSSSASTVYVNDIYSANYGSTEAALYLPTRMKPFPDGQDGVDFLVTVQTPKTFLVSSDRPVNIASRSAISSNLQAEGRP